MAVLSPDRSEGKARFEGTTAFYDHDDRADNKVSGVYSHRAIESSATEMERICDWARYVNELVRYDVRNETGGTLAAGTVVYISGYDADELVYLVAKADADAAATQPQLYIETAIANNSNGVAYNHITVGGLDTSAATLGDAVYASGTAGEWTLTPTGYVIGRVASVHASAGSIEFHPPVSVASYQPLDAGLTSIAGLTTAANKMIYTTDADTYAVADLTAAGRAILDDADAAAQRTTLGLGTIATQAADSVNIDGGAIDGAVIGGNTAAAGTFTTLTTSGNVNIGTSSPAIAARLVVKGDGTNAVASLENGVGTQVASLTNAGVFDAVGFSVGGTAGLASFSGAVTNITVVNGIVTAAS